MNEYSCEKEAKYKFKLTFKRERICNLKKFEESFPFFFFYFKEHIPSTQ